MASLLADLLVDLRKYGDEPASKFSVSLDTRKGSTVWKFFGLLQIKTPNGFKVIDKEHDYCKLCLNALTQANKLKEIYSSVARYKKSVSTGNHLRHIKNDHASNEEVKKLIFSKVESVKDKPKFVSDYYKSLTVDSKKRGNASTSSELKSLLCKDLVLLMAQDCHSFNFVHGHGFQDFCVKYDIIAKPSDMPSSQNLASTSLQEVYEKIFFIVKEVISRENELPRNGVALACDIWTDSNRHLSYQCHRLVYLNQDFDMKKVTLTTSCFEAARHTAENIKKEMKAALKLFDITVAGKNITVIRDRGANIIKACQSDFDSRDCIGHGLHNLLTVDGLVQVEEIDSLIRKSRSIVRTLTYRGAEITKEVHDQKSREFFYVDRLCLLNEMLEADEQIPEIPIVSVAEPSSLPRRYEQYHSLRKDIPTRWSATYAMLLSIKELREPVVTILCRIGKTEFIPSSEEFELIDSLCSFLEGFKNTVEDIEGDEYPTLNIALLYRAHLKHILEEQDSDLYPIHLLKEKLKVKFDSRFPRDDMMVVAAVLDFQLLKLREVDDHLVNHPNENARGRRDFLVYMIKKSISIEDIIPELSSSRLSDTSRPASSSSSSNLMAVNSFQNTIEVSDSDTIMSDNSEDEVSVSITRTQQTLMSGKTNPQKRIFELAQLYSSSDDPSDHQNDQMIQRQVEVYLALANDAFRSKPDFLMTSANPSITFWKINKARVPLVAALARIALGLPATSATAERHFSTSGLILTAKRSTLAPFRANYLQFIHDNHKMSLDALE